MKKLDALHQLKIFSLLIFISSLAGFEYFEMRAAAGVRGLPVSLAMAGEIGLGFWVLLALFEMGLAWAVGGGEKKFFSAAFALSHSPWLLGFAFSAALQFHFPAPQDFAWRKIEILFGVMWVSHLFLYTGWLLWKSRNLSRKVSTSFLIAGLVLFNGLALWTTRCDTSGDEPHYLLMAYSLVHDGDLDLANNYRDGDYQVFYHRGILEPQGLERVANGKDYSVHPLGPVLVILPGFCLGGRLGAALTMASLAAWALFLTLRVLEETGARGLALRGLGWIGLFGSPLLLFSGLIFPEIPTACLVAAGLLLWTRGRWGGWGLCLGLLLWMHNRNDLLVFPGLGLTAYGLWRLKQKRTISILWFACGLFPPLAGLVLYFHALFGVWTPLGAHKEPFSFLFPLHHFLIGFLGLVLDQECGLWFHFPVFALVLGGIWMTLRSKSPLRLVAPFLFVFYYLAMSFFENLGETPATRFLVGVTPILLVLIYPALERVLTRRGWNILAAFLIGVGVLVNWVLAAVPWMRYNKLGGENWILKIVGGLVHLPLTRWEPSFNQVPVEPRSYFLSIFWMTLVAGLTVWFLKSETKPR